MKTFSENKFKELAQINVPHCISIFIPTHRAGQEVNEKIDQINLKNQVQKVAGELGYWQLGSKEIDHLLEPIHALVNDTDFWNNQSDGLAIFRNKDHFEYYTLPVLFHEFVFVSDHYYLKPMVPYLNDDGKYYLLALSLSEVKFYEGFPHQIDEVELDDLLPDKLQDVVGYDFKEKHLQVRSGQTSSNQGMFHGHGKGNEEEKTEIRKYFRAINDGLMKYIKNRKRPLVLAAVDYLVPLYREVNEYKNLYGEFIAGNPEHEDPVLMHEKTREMLKDYFDKERKRDIAAFEQALSNGKASFKEEDIIPAAFNQRIDTLFVKNGEEMWGIFDKASNTVKPRDVQPDFKTCLLNFASIHTLLNNGKVYLLEPDQLPESSSRLNAIFRF